MTRIALVGFGQIGGSVARALRRPEADLGGERPPEIVAWSPSGRGPTAALEAGLIDEVAFSPAAAVADADLVVLAAPPLACLALLDELAGPLRDALSPDATITDVASTKAALVTRARRLGLRFVGGHPMAGRELAGFGGALEDLFVGRPWVIVEDEARPDDIARVRWLAGACGALPVTMDPEVHDVAVAGISHLPLVLAAALVEAVAGAEGRTADGWANAGPLAAGGWASATRLAKGDPTMGAGILATNARPVADRIRAFRAALDRWLSALEADSEGQGRSKDATGAMPDAAALEARLRAARDRLG